MNSLSWKCLAVLALALVATGCGDGGPALYKAGGTVTYKGAPVADAQVTFAYEDGSFANGTTGADGKYSLAYVGKSGGAALGKCKVSITKVAAIKANSAAAAAPTGPIKSKEEHMAREKAKMDAMMQMTKDKEAQDLAGGAASLIPKKYSNPDTSGFAFEITTDASKNDFPLPLVN